MSRGRNQKSRDQGATSQQVDVPPEDEVLEGSDEEPQLSAELPQDGASAAASKEAALSDNWERCADVDDHWINRRDFNVPGAVVPQGTTRSTEEAYALEVRRCG